MMRSIVASVYDETSGKTSVVDYESISKASRDLGLSTHIIESRLESGKAAVCKDDRLVTFDYPLVEKEKK